MFYRCSADDGTDIVHGEISGDEIPAGHPCQYRVPAVVRLIQEGYFFRFHQGNGGIQRRAGKRIGDRKILLVLGTDEAADRFFPVGVHGIIALGTGIEEGADEIRLRCDKTVGSDEYFAVIAGNVVVLQLQPVRLFILLFQQRKIIEDAAGQHGIHGIVIQDLR